MHCPFCNAIDTKVIDSRLVAAGEQVRRRRQCLLCHERFTTFERAELVMPRVIKRDAQREPFNEEKLRRGMRRALEKRPVSSDEVELAIGQITSRLRASGEPEVPGKVIGALVMDSIKSLISALLRSIAVLLMFVNLVKKLPDYRIKTAAGNTRSRYAAG